MNLHTHSYTTLKKLCFETEISEKSSKKGVRQCKDKRIGSIEERKKENKTITDKGLETTKKNKHDLKYSQNFEATATVNL